MDKSSFPQIRIKYGWLLDGKLLPLIQSLIQSKDPDWTPPTREEVFKRVKEMQQVWNKEEQLILKGLYSVTGLQYFQNTIDVYIVTQNKGAFSDPLVIGSNINLEKFNDILTHELIHRLVSDNTRNFDFKKVISEMFPDIKERLILNHIMVHAIHKAIYIDVLKDASRFERDVGFSEKFPAYKEAWRIVNEKGYQELIEQFKKRY